MEYYDNQLATMSENDMVVFVKASCLYRTKIVESWNGRDSDELCGLDRKEVTEKTSTYDVEISVLNYDEKDRQKVLQQLSDLRKLVKK